jgi:hypothetical protein
MDAISASLDCGRLQATAQLMQLVYSGSMSQAACAAAELRLPDLLASGPKHACELAELTGTHLASLHRLLRALASLGLCIECNDGSFELSAAGSILRTDAPGSLRSWTIWYCRHMWAVWGNLLYSVKTGESARKLVTGGDDFGHLERDEQAAAVFNRAMAEMTRLVAREVMRNYDFSGTSRIVWQQFLRSIRRCAASYSIGRMRWKAPQSSWRRLGWPAGANWSPATSSNQFRKMRTLMFSKRSCTIGTKSRAL